MTRLHKFFENLKNFFIKSKTIIYICAVEKNFMFDIEPTPKPRMVKSDSWRKRPCVVRYWQYKDTIREMAEKQGFDGGEVIELVFHIPTRKKKRWNTPHQQRPDIDNLIKSIFDCLWEDDSPIYSVSAYKVWAEIGKIEMICK